MRGKPTVAIIGGGIGGLAAALAFQRRGIEVRVYERSPSLVEIGAGLNLSPNALKSLRYLGVEAEAIKAGYQDEYQYIRSWRSWRIIARNYRGGGVAQFGAGYLTVHRADLQEILARALAPNTMQLGFACTGVTAQGARALATFEDGRKVDADIVIGADGIHSAVRRSLFGNDAPRFTGCVCWRGMVPVEALKDSPISTEMTSWWGPHGHVVHYRVRGGAFVNFVAHYDSEAWLDESWTRECESREILETYQAWHQSLKTLFRFSERSYKWALFDRDPLDQWGRGAVSLLGDAAHPMLPYLGQGASMALEDGCVLADCVATEVDTNAALRKYEKLRMPRTRRAQLGSRERAKENHMPSAWSRLKRDVQLAIRTRFGKDTSTNRGAWIYEYDPAQMALDGGVERTTSGASQGV
jgi:salicylate hydroxylase